MPFDPRQSGYAVNMSNGRTSVKKFIALWIGGLALCFFIMAAMLIWSTTKLQTMTSRILIDSEAIEASHYLVKSILGERREDLLWFVTGDEWHHDASLREQEESARIVSTLRIYATADDEIGLIRAIEKQFSSYRHASEIATPQTIDSLSALADSLVSSITAFREQNRVQMADALESSKKLNRTINRCSIALIGVVALIMVTGTVALINRIFQPTFSLIRTARTFGKGDYSVRAEIFKNDELGMLCETFNDMADNIANLQRERVNFVATVAHDLKNPIVLVGMAANRLKKKLEISEKEAAWLDIIIQQVEFLENTIGDLMDSAQVELGNLALNLTDIDLNILVRDIQKSQNEIITTHTIMLESASECRIRGDRRRLERVLSNLISNAVKYSPKDTSIYLKVSACADGAVLTVRDEGTGMSDSEIERLFKPFSRLARTRDMAKGAGLGLFSVKKIIDGHGGTIAIDSVPDKGTTFKIILPLINSNSET